MVTLESLIKENKINIQKILKKKVMDNIILKIPKAILKIKWTLRKRVKIIIQIKTPKSLIKIKKVSIIETSELLINVILIPLYLLYLLNIKYHNTY